MILIVIDKNTEYLLDIVNKDNKIEKITYTDFLNQLVNFVNETSNLKPCELSYYFCNDEESKYDTVIDSIFKDERIDGVISFGSNPYKIITSSSMISSRIKKPTLLETFYEKKQFILSTEHGEIPYWASVNPNNFTRGQEINYLEFNDRYNRLSDLIISIISYMQIKLNYE